MRRAQLTAEWEAAQSKQDSSSKESKAENPQPDPERGSTDTPDLPATDLAPLEVYVLNAWDFPEKEDMKQVKLNKLDNLLNTPIKDLYPRGFQLLEHFGWEDGQPLGANVDNKDAIQTHIGFIFSERRRQAGLGADQLDAVFREWQRGNFDYRANTAFRQAPPNWTQNDKRVL